MSEAKQGDTVVVHYRGILQDGTVFGDSNDKDPLEFKLGEGQVIPGFEEAVAGMNPGESTKIELPVDKAFGPRRDELVAQVNREDLPEHIDPQVGQSLEVKLPDGETLPVTVTEVGESEVTLDGNHPLAGKDLSFELTLVEIKEES